MSKSFSGVSGSSGFSTPLTPFAEHPGTPGNQTPGGEYPLERRTAQSRSASIVGGQLAQSFADLTASEREWDRRSPIGLSPLPGDMPPPDRRASAPFPHTATQEGQGPSHIHLLPPRPPSTGPDALRRHSLTRPSSPEPSRPTLRRSSLTELIMSRAGDDVAMASGRFNPSPSNETTPKQTSSLSEPPSGPSGLSPQPPIITEWTTRRISTESSASTPPISQSSDTEGPVPSIRGRKRHVDGGAMDVDEVINMKGDPGMRGMEVLAESARRVSEAEGSIPEDGDPSPSKAGQGGQGAQVGSAGQSGTVVGPKYACAFCAKTFSRPSSLRIHTYSREFTSLGIDSNANPWVRYGRTTVCVQRTIMSTTVFRPVESETTCQSPPVRYRRNVDASAWRTDIRWIHPDVASCWCKTD